MSDNSARETRRACVHPVIEEKEGGVGVCVACGEQLGLVAVNGQPYSHVPIPGA